MKLKDKLKSIWQGWKNDYLDKRGKLSPEVKVLADSRLAVCRSNVCGVFLAGVCTACGCPVKKKAKSLDEYCPKNMWKPVIYEYNGIEFIKISEVPVVLWDSLQVFMSGRQFPIIEGLESKDAIYAADWYEFLKSLK